MRALRERIHLANLIPFRKEKALATFTPRAGCNYAYRAQLGSTMPVVAR